MQPSLHHQFDDLLQQNAASAARFAALQAEISALDGNSVVLFGAGKLGDVALAGLRKRGLEPLAFADNNPAVWGSTKHGIAIFSPDEAARRFGRETPFVVTIYTGYGVRRHLRERGLRAVPFAHLFFRYPDVFIPYFALDVPAGVYAQAEQVRSGLGLWEDEASRAEYVAQVRYRLLLDDRLPPSLPPETICFPEELAPLSDHESFVDCGAFDGDSLRSFFHRCRGRFRQVFAIEPDPLNCRRLRDYVAGLESGICQRITVLQHALGKRRETVHFNATGTVTSTVGGGGTYEVECLPLDELVFSGEPTYLKMDIEGAEPAALEGAKKIIQTFHPVLAVCLYHQQDHLWRIPLLIRSINPEYRLYLRRYSDDCWEQVCYAVPPERS